MQLYRWQARTDSGKLMKGEYLARNPDEVAAFVRRNYGWVTGITKVEQRLSFFRPFLNRNHVSKKQCVLFYRQLSALLRSGIPILNALELLEQKPTLKMQKVCHELQMQLKRGLALSEAIARQKNLFGTLDFTLVQAGEASGELENTLSALADYYEERRSLTRFILNACAYPIFLLILTFLTFLFFMVKVLPLFAELFESFGIEGGALLKFMLALGAFPAEHMPLLLAFTFLAFCLLRHKRTRLSAIIKGFSPVQALLWKLEEIGFVRLLALLLQSGVALPNALSIASGAVSGDVSRRKLLLVQDGLIRGLSLAEATALAGSLFSALVVEFINVGETSGELAAMLTEAAKILEKEFKYRIQSFKILLEPLLILIVASVILAMVITVLQPMFTMIANMPD